MTRRRPVLSLFLLVLASCVTERLAGLDPRPRLPPAEGFTTVLRLGDGIAPSARVPGGPLLETFRADLERGFLNGFPGARRGKQGELHLGLSVAEPGLSCSGSGGCRATLRFKGELVSEALEGTSFAGTVKTQPCGDAATCFSAVIALMYEQIYAAVKAELPR